MLRKILKLLKRLAENKNKSLDKNKTLFQKNINRKQKTRKSVQKSI